MARISHHAGQNASPTGMANASAKRLSVNALLLGALGGMPAIRYAPAMDMARASSCSWPPAAASRLPSSAVVHVFTALAWSLEPPWERIVLTLKVVTCSHHLCLTVCSANMIIKKTESLCFMARHEGMQSAAAVKLKPAHAGTWQVMHGLPCISAAVRKKSI